MTTEVETKEHGPKIGEHVRLRSDHNEHGHVYKTFSEPNRPTQVHFMHAVTGTPMKRSVDELEPVPAATVKLESKPTTVTTKSQSIPTAEAPTGQKNAALGGVAPLGKPPGAAA